MNKTLALSLTLSGLLLGACAQAPYVKSEKTSGPMMNAAEADNQAARRRAILSLQDPPQPSPTLTPLVTPIPSKVNQ
jgi:hypothetical protein